MEEFTAQSFQGLITFGKDLTVSDLFKDKGKKQYDSDISSIKFLLDNKIIQQPINMLDIGANIGYVSLGLIKSGLVEKSLDIEPEPDNFRLLEKNVEQNSYKDKIHCINTALGCRPLTTETMELSPFNYGDHRIQIKNTLIDAQDRETERKTITVPSTTLSEILNRPEIKKWIEPINFISIDVQGYEGHIFKDREFKNIITKAEIWPYGILRSGMSLSDFNDIVCSNWEMFTDEEKQYPIKEFYNKFLLTFKGRSSEFRDFIFYTK